MKKPPKIFCSFCGRHSNEVLVIPGPNEANICVDCAKQVVEIVNEAEARDAKEKKNTLPALGPVPNPKEIKELPILLNTCYSKELPIEVLFKLLASLTKLVVT